MAIVIVKTKGNAYLASVVSLAQKVYKKEDVSPMETYASLYKKNPDAFFFAVDSITQQLVGYIIALPLEHSYFERTTEPDFDESCLSDMVVLPWKKGNNKIYLFSIVSNPDHPMKLSILKALTLAFINQLRELAKDGYYTTQASALALTDAGIKLCKGMRMDPVNLNDKGAVFIHRSFRDIYWDKPTEETVLRRFSLKQKTIK